MTNYEKYKEVMLRCIAENNCFSLIDGVPYQNIRCENCDFYSDCADGEYKVALKEWANEECEPIEADWSRMPLDTPILVKNDTLEPYKRMHFAKYENGKVYAWDKGHTSYTSFYDDAKTSSWAIAKPDEDFADVWGK